MGRLGGIMSPIAYYNFESITNGQTSDIIGGTAFSGVTTVSDAGIRNSYAIIISASGAPQINISGTQSLNFWVMGQEYRKPGYPQYQSAQVNIFRSGMGPYYPQADTFWNLNLKNNGDLTWRVGNQSLITSGIDVGRWNHIYCEYDEQNSRIGMSVNATNKIYTNYSGGVPSDQSRFYIRSTTPWYFDEIGIYSGILSQSQIEERYSNFRGYSYSGSLNTQWMYPQSDVYVQGSGQSYDFPNEAGKWYQDELQIVQVPFGRRWEYINDSSEKLVSLSHSEKPGLYTTYTEDRKIRVGLGKLLVKPSSVYGYMECQPTNVNASGYFDSVHLYDKNGDLIASGCGGEDQNYFYYTGSALQFPNPIQCSFIDVNNKDFSDTSAIFGFKKVSGSDVTPFALQGVRLFVSGVSVAYTGLNLIGSGGIDKNSHVDLYTQAYSSGSRSLDLYTAGHLPDSSGIPLYIYGAQPINSGLDLYMYGWDTRSSGIDLFIGGHIGLNSGVPLYTYGANTHTASMNLFTKYEPIERSGGFNLFTFASDDPSVQRSVDLYLKTALASSVVGTMSLYTAGPDTGSTYADMPLFLENNTYNYGSVELFLQNAYQSGFKGLKLFVDGEGTLDGGLPYSDSMPLFIERTEGVQGGLSMFMAVNNGVGSGLNMFTKGGTYASSGLDLSIPSTYSENSGVLKLMIRGY
jgi:hypothetical protein